MACRSCDLKRIYRLFEEKKRREAEEAKALAEAAEREAKEAEEKARREAEESAKRTRKKKVYEPVEVVVDVVEKPVADAAEEIKEEDPVVEDVKEETKPEDDFILI